MNERNNSKKERNKATIERHKKINKRTRSKATVERHKRKTTKEGNRRTKESKKERNTQRKNETRERKTTASYSPQLWWKFVHPFLVTMAHDVPWTTIKVWIRRRLSLPDSASEADLSAL